MFERCLYFNSNVLARKLTRQWEEAFAPFDLSPSHAYVLRAVLDQEGCSQQALADQMQIERSTLARFVEALASKGLVVRKSGQTDGRNKLVYPSRIAKTIHGDLEAVGGALYADLCRKHGAEKVKGLVSLMREIADDL